MAKSKRSPNTRKPHSWLPITQRFQDTGHNYKSSAEKIIDFVGANAVTTKEISQFLGVHLLTVQKTTYILQQEGRLVKFKGSKYCLPEYANIYCDNPLILCGCGCGQEFLKFDDYGRARKYKSGHNQRKK